MKYAFYGTLRKGMSNYGSFQSNLRYIKIAEIAGFRMYSRGSYPYVVQSGNNDEKIVAELFEVLTEETKIEIDNLEFDSGYILDQVVVDNQKFGIYVFKQNIVGDPLINSGNWAHYVQENHF